MSRIHLKGRRYRQDALELRKALPVLNRREIRRVRIPYDEALLCELNEDGFRNAAEFLRQLCDYQDNYRLENATDVIIQSQLVLREESQELSYLQEALRRAEMAHIKHNASDEIDEFLRISYKYAFGIPDWFWLAEQFFHQILQMIKPYEDGFHRAMAYYIYGKYLVQQTEAVHLGTEYLNQASKISQGKKWYTAKITGRMENTIFRDVCAVLCKTLEKQVHFYLKINDSSKALEICKEARQRYIDACIPRADIYFLQGKCEIVNRQAEKAVGSFMQAFYLFKTKKEYEKCCEAMLSLAHAFQQLDQWDESKNQLDRLLVFTEKHELVNYMGEAYLSIGQYYLSIEKPDLASPFLTQSIGIFDGLNDSSRLHLVKNIGAVSKSLETFEQYVNLILSCEDSDAATQAISLTRLLRWKDDRTPFWEEKRESMKECITSDATEDNRSFIQSIIDELY